MTIPPEDSEESAHRTASIHPLTSEMIYPGSRSIGDTVWVDVVVNAIVLSRPGHLQ
jgi:hypothetical protein